MTATMGIMMRINVKERPSESSPFSETPKIYHRFTGPFLLFMLHLSLHIVICREMMQFDVDSKHFTVESGTFNNRYNIYPNITKPTKETFSVTEKLIFIFLMKYL